MSNLIITITLAAIVATTVTLAATFNDADDTVTYRAASVAHSPVGLVAGATPRSVIADNLAVYDSLTATAKSQGADIILMPESGTGFLQVPPAYMTMLCEPVPPVGWIASAADCATPNNGANESTTTMPHATWASCAASAMKINIVINFCDTVPDPNNASAVKHYNVDVFFDDHGALQSVHEKNYITGTGPILSQPVQPDPTVFHVESLTLDFAIVTCYAFWFPASTEKPLAEGVTNVLFNSEMYSAVPYYSVLSAASGYSLAKNVNIINSVSAGNAGAGAVSSGVLAPNVIYPTPQHTFGDINAVVVNSVTSKRNKKPQQNNNKRRPSKHSISSIEQLQQLYHNKKQTLNTVLFDNESNKNNNRHAMQMAKHNEQMMITVRRASSNNNKTTCWYGPAKFPRLHFEIGCDIIQKPVAGTEYNLASRVDAPGLSADCSASLFVRDASPDAATVLLAAISVGVTPTIDTPSSTVNGGCIVVRCPHPETGCMTDDPLGGWDGDIKIARITVNGTFTGENITDGKPLLTFPFVAITNRAGNAPHTNSSFHGFEARPISTSKLTQSNKGRTLSISADIATSPELRGNNLLHNAGAWVTAFWGTLPGYSRKY